MVQNPSAIGLALEEGGASRAGDAGGEPGNQSSHCGTVMPPRLLSREREQEERKGVRLSSRRVRGILGAPQQPDQRLRTSNWQRLGSVPRRLRLKTRLLRHSRADS